MADILIRRRKFEHRNTDTQGEGHGKMDAEIAVKHLQAMERQGLPATIRRQKKLGRIFP